MQKRKSHNKSRRGCSSCKSRHVKCDEQGPSCANCVIRKIPCVYLSTALAGPNGSGKSRNSNLGPQSRNRVSSSPSSTGGSDDKLNLNSTIGRVNPWTADSRAQQQPLPQLTNSQSLSPSPSAFSSTPEGSRLLELELMHRWSTRTWTGLYAIPEDQSFLQDHLPRAALQNSYLLNGILAISAADLALSSGDHEAANYLRIAVEYSDKASVDFRTQVSDINAENINVLYYFAMIAAIFNFAIPVQHLSAINRMNMAFGMVLGACQIAAVNIEWLLASQSSMAIIASDYGANLEFMNDLDAETMVAISRLSSVSRMVRVSHITPTAQQAGTQGPFANELPEYRLAVGQTKYCFAEDLQDRLKGHCWSVVVVAGTGFATWLRAKEPVALFVAMYWGVLMHRTGLDPMMWFVKSAGIDLVAEISEFLLASSIGHITDVREGIAWTRQQVGLPPLDGCTPPDVSQALKLQTLNPEKPLWMV